MPKTKLVRGSDKKCPKCGCTKVRASETLQHKGYGPGLACCINCGALWEHFTMDMVWDPDDPVCSFAAPCNNCAFRKGSPEQQDPEQWEALLKEVNPEGGGTFYCHKGVPIEAGAKDGFAYPENPKKLRMCRGWLNFYYGQVKAEAAENAG